MTEAEKLAIALFTVESGGTPPAPIIMKMQMWKDRVRRAEQALHIMRGLK